MKNILALLVLIIILSKNYSQEYVFDVLDINDVLISDFIYDIEQDNKGNLLISTGEGLGIYNGKEVKMYYEDDGLSENFINTSYKTADGDIWLGHKGGGVTLYKDGVLEMFHSGEGINSIITDISEDKEGRIWVVTQNKGLYFIDKKGEFKFFQHNISGENISSLYIDDDMLIIGSEIGLEIHNYHDNSLIKRQEVDAIKNLTVVDICETNNNESFIATRNSGIYLLSDIQGVQTAHKINSDVTNIIINEIDYSDNLLYVATMNKGVLKFAFKNDKLELIENYNTKSGLITNYINTLFIDRENQVWIGTYGDGLISKSNDYFSFYLKDKLNKEEITDIKINKTHLYVSSYEGVYKYRKQNFILENYWWTNSGLPNDRVICFTFSSDSTLFVGTEQSGLYYKRKNQDEFSIVPSLSTDLLSSSIKCIHYNNGKIWIGTLNGVFKINEENFAVSSYNISTGLPHNNVGYIYSDKDNVYIGTKSSYLYVISEDKDENKKVLLSKELNIVNANMIVSDKNNGLWLSSEENGIFHILNDSIKQYTSNDGLLSNYCHGLFFDSKNRLWISHNMGLSYINPQSSKIETFNEKHGLDMRFLNNSIDGNEDEIWFGSFNGIVKYDVHQKFINTTAPVTTIDNIIINDKQYKQKGVIDLAYGEYEIEFIFNGLSLRNPTGVKYEYMLTSYNNSWSNISNINSARYPKLSDGIYEFKVRSYNSDNIIGNEASFRIEIRAPYWKKLWFYIVVITILVLIVILLIKRRERNLIRYQEMLKQQLDFRTKEVVEQKEKIEEINKDLTDSINYAKRIQLQLLPEKENFKSILPSSFVLYMPKDIVSGDFYWIKDDDKEIILACADCTGHGVPGGFMSMISSILIHEAVEFHKKTIPAEILTEVDINIRNILHQKNDFDSNKDGMDVAIININKKTGLMNFSGAIRSCYIYRNSERLVLKGDRYSIGGYIIDDKKFTNQSFKLQKGDLVYLFSDGFPDQFGGERMRKLKMSGFNKLIDEYSSFPINLQKDKFNTFIKDWIGEGPQMDDILLICFEY